jgi:hypothetical protein
MTSSTRLRGPAQAAARSTLLAATLFLSACQPEAPAPPSPAPPQAVPPTAAPGPPATTQPSAVPATTQPATAVVLPTTAPLPTPPAAVASPAASPAAAPSPQPGQLPLRLAQEAIRSYAGRIAASTATLPESDLEGILKTPLSDSRVGFVNGHLFLASESRAASHFSYALNPLYNEGSDGRQRYLVFGNTPNFLNYRSGNLGEQLQANSDRAIWAVNNGLRAVTVIQIDNDLSDDLLRYIVASRAVAGFRSFVIGNEFNDPGAPWRYNFARLLHAAKVARDTLTDLKVDGATIYTPSLAYFESDTYLDNFLDYAEANFKPIPSDGISTNFYGSVDSVRQHISSVYNVMTQHRLGHLKLRIGELGNPTGSFQQPFSDEQLAYNYLPQAVALALSTGRIESLDLYTLFAFGDDQYSLTSLAGATLTPKPSLLSALVATRALARVRNIDYREDGEIRRVVVERTDGVRLWLIWSASDTADVAIKRPENAEVYGALGNRLNEDTIVLTPRPHPALGGTLKYVLLSK